MWYRLVFNSTRFKFYIHLPSINTQRQTTAPFDNTPIISSSNHQTTWLYQRLANCCEEDRNSDIIRLLQPYQAISYCNKSVLVIVTDLNIFVFSIKIFDIISRSALVRFSLLRGRNLHNLTGLRFYIFFSLPSSCLGYRHSHMWVHFIHTKKITVACMSSLLLYIDQQLICYFISFYLNWPMVQWRNGVWLYDVMQKKLLRLVISFFTNIEYVYLFYFRTKHFCW